MRRSLNGWSALLAAATGFVMLILGGCEPPPVEQTQPPTEVSVITVQPQDIPVKEMFVAQVQSSHHVDIFPRVSGFLEQISYREGGLVKKGDVMFQLDPRPFLTQVESVRAEIEIRKAQLETAQANLDRIRPLADLDAASKSDLDNAVGSVKAAQAALAEVQARFTKAELDLSYATIKAPTTGVAGQSSQREGAYVSASGALDRLTYVAALDPVWVEFSVSQNAMDKTRQELDQGILKLPNRNNYLVELEFSDGTRYPHTGKLSFAEPSFSQQTGTFLVRAELPNPEGQLRPGMFVKARLSGAVRPNSMVVPQKAVLQSPNGQIVFVLGDQNRAEVRPVVVGDWLDEGWVVYRGLHAGDQVIVDGLMRLVPGTPVRITTSTATPDTSSPSSPAAD